MGAKLLTGRASPTLYKLRIQVSYITWDMDLTILVPETAPMHACARNGCFTLPRDISSRKKEKIRQLAVGEVEIACDIEGNLYRIRSEEGEADLASYYPNKQ